MKKDCYPRRTDFDQATREGSHIVDKISRTNPLFGDRMPLDRTPLDSEEISLIQQWIEEGAQNN